jgi:predicted DNA-binding transcriptional regulator AlpA
MDCLDATGGNYMQLEVPLLSQLVLVDRRGACEILGGNRPLNPATLYRGIKARTYPKPIKIGSSSRWLESELLACIAARVADRDASL